MAEANNLILEHLHHLRGQLDRMENGIGERFASIASTRKLPVSKSGSTSWRARHQSSVRKLKGSNPCH